MVAALMLIFLAVVLLPRNAHAYLDAGTGSMLIQALVASAAAVMVVVRLHWSRIMRFFGRMPPELSEDAEEHGEN